MDSVAQALADPIRREILRLLRQGGVSAGDLAVLVGGRFGVSRPAISRHLRVLREAGLAVDEAQGRERIYQLRVEPLVALEDFMAELRAPNEWDRRFAALDTEVHRQKRRSGAAAGPPRSETSTSQPKKKESA